MNHDHSRSRYNKPRAARSTKRARGASRISKPRSQVAVSGVSRTDTSTVVRMITPPLFPARSKHKMLPYYSNSSLTVPNTGLGVSYVYTANGLYDPDISGTGGQPSGFDQMMVFYEHYTVFNCRAVVTFRNFSATIAPIVYLAVRGDTGNISVVSSIMETGNTVSTQLMPAGVTGSLKELVMRVNVGAFLGFDDLMDSTVARGDLASNPAEQVYFHVGAFYNEASGTGDVKFQIRLEYDAVFSEARVITPSLASKMNNLFLSDAEEKKMAMTKRCR